MLDDPNFISKFDHHNGLAIIAGQAEQLGQKYEFDSPAIDEIHEVVFAGMGGSALAGEFFASWTKDSLKAPFVVSRGYDLPKYVDKNTLVIVSSYSGNTEETLSCFEQAKKSGAAIAILSAGGKLAEHGKEHTLMQIPTGWQPRLTVLYGAKAIATLLEEVGVAEGLADELEAQQEWLKGQARNWEVGVAQDQNQAKQIASELAGHAVVVYGGDALEMPALKWKIDFNENAKNLAFWNRFPELNHNEFIGWGHPYPNHLKLIELRSTLDHPRVQKRFDVTNKLLSGKLPAPITVEATGDTKLRQMLSTMLLGTFTAAYLAFLNQEDPIPVDLVEKFKKELG